jgi:superfamily II DNA/RNA helicase
MFSATFSPEIKKLAATFLNDPVTIEVARSNATADKVTQVVYKVSEENKRDAVAHILRSRELKQVIVFSNTKIGASRLARGLEQEGMKASAIHGDKTQQERMAALEAFKRGEIDVLVATDVAARGLDITDLPCVINYDLPYNAEDYVHRIGRTGRAGASGDAISIFSDKDERLLVDIEKLIKQTIKRAELTGFSPSARTAEERHGERRTPRRVEGERSPGGNSHAGGTGGSYAANGAGNGGRPERPERSADRSPTYDRGPRPSGPRRDKVDPWFLKPYEPTRGHTTATTTTTPSSSSSSKPKPKLAALLGGLRKE